MDYIRSIELQERGSPHIHTIIALDTQFRCPLCDSTVIVQDVYDALQRLWYKGLSKFESIYPVTTNSLSYVTKYVAKSTTDRTLWRHIYQVTSDLDAYHSGRFPNRPHLYQHRDPVEAARQLEPVPYDANSRPTIRPTPWLNPDLKSSKLKLLTYSRKFPLHYFLQRNCTLPYLEQTYDQWIQDGAPQLPENKLTKTQYDQLLKLDSQLKQSFKQSQD